MIEFRVVCSDGECTTGDTFTDVGAVVNEAFRIRDTHGPDCAPHRVEARVCSAWIGAQSFDVGARPLVMTRAQEIDWWQVARDLVATDPKVHTS